MQIIKASNILLGKDEDLNNIREMLNVPDANKIRILRLLNYIGMLDNDMSLFDLLPDDILVNVVEKFDCDEIFSLCRISTRFSRFCQSRSFRDLISKRLSKTRLDIKDFSLDELGLLCQRESLIPESLSVVDKIKRGGLSITLYKSGYKTIDRKAANSIPSAEILSSEFDKRTNIVSLSERKDNILALTEDGDVIAILKNWKGKSLQHLIRGLSGIAGIFSGEFDNRDVTVFITRQGRAIFMNESEIVHIPLMNIIEVAVGAHHIFFLTRTGSVYRYRDVGKTRNVSINELSSYEKIKAIPQIIEISAGGFTELFLTRDKRIYAPTLIASLSGIIQIVSAKGRSLFLDKYGNVWIMGRSIESPSEFYNTPILYQRDYRISSGSHERMFFLQIKEEYMVNKEKREQWVTEEKTKLDKRKANGELTRCNCCDSSSIICDYCKYNYDFI